MCVCVWAAWSIICLPKTLLFSSWHLVLGQVFIQVILFLVESEFCKHCQVWKGAITWSCQSQCYRFSFSHGSEICCHMAFSYFQMVIQDIKWRPWYFVYFLKNQISYNHVTYTLIVPEHSVKFLHHFPFSVDALFWFVLLVLFQYYITGDVISNRLQCFLLYYYVMHKGAAQLKHSDSIKKYCLLAQPFENISWK